MVFRFRGIVHRGGGRHTIFGVLGDGRCLHERKHQRGNKINGKVYFDVAEDTKYTLT
ncbi:hypothetical protein [Saccharococcus caldoxylosilyticus]|uniref:hypothetical protein n=1 Tax=Saccharococcus caldoxylosilyticus TaxID=81408 RepID=UPI001FCCA500|nr:hypothetical protein [Parageobacillus caldoxylosilyticus]